LRVKDNGSVELLTTRPQLSASFSAVERNEGFGGSETAGPRSWAETRIDVKEVPEAEGKRRSTDNRRCVC
jgi:hypothetical protein